MAKILVGMSGGVDSSVAAKLLLDQGHEVAGVTLKLYSNEDPANRKTGPHLLLARRHQDARSPTNSASSTSLIFRNFAKGDR